MPSKYNKYPFWTPRFWHGMRFRDWIQLCNMHRWRISPSRWAMAVIISFLSVVNSLASGLQFLVYGRKIRDVQLTEPPIFIVGHWRSGTTMLHELMVCDPRFNCPNTYECFVPHHFLVSQWWVPKVLGFLVPKRRPMDNMKVGMDLPQEDEFALMNLGLPSPYGRMAFPNDPPVWQHYLNLDDLSSRETAVWCRNLQLFANALQVGRPGRLVFKSPTHTGRIKRLSQLFPGAKFIHISRDPRALFPSTLRLWKALDTVQGLQIADIDNEQDDANRVEYVLSSLESMYDHYLPQAAKLDANQLMEIRYEDLVQDPLGTMKTIFETLDLGEFESARPHIETWCEQRKGYTPTPHPELPAEIVEAMRGRWRNYAEKYGYSF